jgi:hypothetical protein
LARQKALPIFILAIAVVISAVLPPYASRIQRILAAIPRWWSRSASISGSMRVNSDSSSANLLGRLVGEHTPLSPFGGELPSGGRERRWVNRHDPRRFSQKASLLRITLVAVDQLAPQLEDRLVGARHRTEERIESRDRRGVLVKGTPHLSALS